MPQPAKIVAAECPTCGKRRFLAGREPPEPEDILTCESCGLKLSYGFLRSRLEPTAPARKKPRAAKRSGKARAKPRKR